MLISAKLRDATKTKLWKTCWKGDDDIVSFDVTVTAYQENGQWKIHPSPEFINAFSGNMYDYDYSEEMQQRMDELEKQYETKIDNWAEDFEVKFKILQWGDFWR